VIQWLNKENQRTAGLVVAQRMTYSFYSDPDSDQLIGRTDKGVGFFISLLEDYSFGHFLRLNKAIVTSEEFSVESLKAHLKEEEQFAGQKTPDQPIALILGLCADFPNPEKKSKKFINPVQFPSVRSLLRCHETLTKIT